MASGIEPTSALAQIEAYRRSFRQRQQRAIETREKRRRAALRAVRSKVPTLLAAYSSVQRAYLFGSVTRPGAFQSASDIDIALEGTTAADYFAVWRELERALPDWMVDVREIAFPSPFADLIRQTGILIYERTDSAAPDRDTR